MTQHYSYLSLSCSLSHHFSLQRGIAFSSFILLFLLPQFCRLFFFFFFLNDTATPEISTLPLHDALPISGGPAGQTQRNTGWHNGTSHCPPRLAPTHRATHQPPSASCACNRDNLTPVLELWTKVCSPT